MRAHDVMTSNVVTVGENASVQDVALVLLQNQISAVPVIDRMGNVVGIVSEGDLMRRPNRKRRSGARRGSSFYRLSRRWRLNSSKCTRGT